MLNLKNIVIFKNLHNVDYDNHHPALLGQDHNNTI